MTRDEKAAVRAIVAVGAGPDADVSAPFLVLDRVVGGNAVRGCWLLCVASRYARLLDVRSRP